jgi:hypothetical protein
MRDPNSLTALITRSFSSSEVEQARKNLVYYGVVDPSPDELVRMLQFIRRLRLAIDTPKRKRADSDKLL